MDLFETTNKITPLAWRMRPKKIEDFVGQRHVMAQGKLLRRVIESDKVRSLIIFGPPGSGKTAIAHLIADLTRAQFIEINAVTAGIAEIRNAIERAKEWNSARGERTLLFIDEIHRFNKVQQDALLPYVEQGIVTLIGVSTQNPFFSIIPSLSSRSLIIEFKPLDDEDLSTLLEKALHDKEAGVGGYEVTITEDAAAHLIRSAEGDARRLLNALEVGILTTKPGADGKILYDLNVAAESVQKKYIRYEDGDSHYDTISAFVKSMRGSDPDAALYWLAKMVYAGEDPLFIARRIVICASEDVGMADPRALSVAVSALHAVEAIGMPEGRIPLAQAAVYIAAAPKSNACYKGIEAALSDVESGKIFPVPDYLKDSHYKGAARLGRVKGYKYPHDFGGYVEKEYVPGGVSYYNPTGNGFEGELRKRLEGRKKVEPR
ncbi:MAG: replication-associated recombination protein A, partial [Nitrospirae bacterium]|nr:replication-associated recombination protein A [Nitrospirota bacterium]